MTTATDRLVPRPFVPGRLARGTILASAALTIMAPAIIAPSLPAMRLVFADQNGADLLVRLTMTITSLAIAVSAPVSGLISDRLGRRRVLVSGLVLYAVSGTSGYFTSDLFQLLATRALLGVAVGAIMTAVSATITDWFDGAERASFLSLQQVFAGLGGVVFLPLAGVLATIGWRVPFWLYGLAPVVALFAIVAVRDGQRAAVETSAPDPTRRRAGTGDIIGIYALALAVTVAFYMAPTQIPFHLEGLGLGPAAVGAIVAGSTLTSALGALGFPALRRRVNTSAVTAVSIGLLGAGWLLIGVTGTAVGAALGVLVGGVGVGFAVPNLTLRLSELAAPARRGRVLSGFVAGVFLGQFLSPLVVQPLVGVVGVGGAFTWAGAALAAGAAVAAVAMRRRRSVTGPAGAERGGTAPV